MTATPEWAPASRPSTPRVQPGICHALKSGDDLHTYCEKPARLYLCGWRCDDHRPGAHRNRTIERKAA